MRERGPLRSRRPGFETVRKEAVATSGMQWELKMAPITGIMAGTASTGFTSTPSSPTLQIVSQAQPEAAAPLLINGSVSNGASTPFALSQAFGNSRRGLRSLYTGDHPRIGKQRAARCAFVLAHRTEHATAQL